MIEPSTIASADSGSELSERHSPAGSGDERRPLDHPHKIGGHTLLPKPVTNDPAAPVITDGVDHGHVGSQAGQSDHRRGYRSPAIQRNGLGLLDFFPGGKMVDQAEYIYGGGPQADHVKFLRHLSHQRWVGYGRIPLLITLKPE